MYMTCILRWYFINFVLTLTASIHIFIVPRSDLIRILGKILKKGKMDAIIIETTGLADPAPVAQTFFMDEKIKSLARIDGILTVVDAKHIIQHLDEEKPEGVENEAVEQVAFADRMLINKCDLVDEDYLNVVEARLRAINRDAPFTRCIKSQVPLAKLLGIGAFNLENVIKIDPDFLGDETKDDEHECGENCNHDHGHGHGHGHGQPKMSSTLNEDGSRKMDGKKKVHSHDNSTSSVGIREVGELNMVSSFYSFYKTCHTTIVTRLLSHETQKISNYFFHLLLSS